MPRGRNGEELERAANYARFSTDMQNDRSVEDQLDLCKAYARRHGLPLVAQASRRSSRSRLTSCGGFSTRPPASVSPQTIAAALNKDNVPPPRGTLWNASTINGSKTRGHGILRNPVYAGRLVWSRVRMVKDPATGRRVSRERRGAISMR